MQADPSNTQALLAISLLIAASQIIRGLTQVGRNFSSEILGQRMERDARDEIYGSLMGKSMSFHDSHPTGELMARATNDVREINLMINPGLNLVIGSAMLPPHPDRGRAALRSDPVGRAVGLPAALRAQRPGIYLRQLAPTTRAVRRVRPDEHRAWPRPSTASETVKGAAQEESEISRFRRAVDDWRRAYVWQGDVEARFYRCLLLGLAAAAALAQSLYLYQAGAINVGDVVAYIGLMLLFDFPHLRRPVRLFAGLLRHRQRAAHPGDAEPGDEAGPERGRPQPDRCAAPWQFDHVTFGYDGDVRPCTTSASALEPGQTVAIVGQTGSGKSTVAKLINRIYDVNAGPRAGRRRGRARLEPGRAAPPDLDHRAGHLPVLAAASPRTSPLAASRPTRSEIEAAASKAQAHDFIIGFPRRLRDRGGRAGRDALRRSAPAHRPGPRLSDRPAHPDPGRLDQRHRQRHRRPAFSAPSSSAARGPHHHPDHPPPLADPLGRPDRRAAQGGRVAAIGTHEELLEQSEAYRNIFASYE